MKGRISTSMLALAALGTHETGVVGFAAPLSRHALGASVGPRHKHVGIGLFRQAAVHSDGKTAVARV